MSARKVKRRKASSDLERQAAEALRRHYELEIEDLTMTLAGSTRELKQMCDLCDKQRAQIATQDAKVGSQYAEINYLNSLIRLLVRGAAKETK